MDGFEITWDYVRNDLDFYDIEITDLYSQNTETFKFEESPSPRLSQHLTYLFSGLKRGYEYSVILRATDLKGQTGAYSKPLIVKVVDKQLKPFLVKSPTKEIRAAEGKDITIKCVVEALPEPSFNWFKDGEGLIENSEIVIKGGELTLKNLKREEDDGKYKCKATNELGMVESSEGKLVVECKFKLRFLISIYK